MKKYVKKLWQNLVVSKKSCNFATDLRNTYYNPNQHTAT